MATYLDDIVESISNILETPSLPLMGDEDLFNTLLDDGAFNNNLILYDLAQSGRLAIQGNKFAYLEYDAVFLFLTLPVNATEPTTGDILQAKTDMIDLAWQFFAKLQDVTAWNTHPSNIDGTLIPTFQEVYDQYDTRVAGVSCTYTVKIVPDFDMTKVCS